MKIYMHIQVRDTRPTGELAARTLLITDIPKDQCSVESLTVYLKYVKKNLLDYKIAFDK